MRQGYPSGGKQSFASASGVFSAGKVVQDPRPIVFGIGVLAEVLSRWDCMGQKHRIRCRDIQPKVTGIRSRIARVRDGDGIRLIVPAISESRHAEGPVAVGVGEISAEGEGRAV